jgi:hypothetical protein
MIMILNREVLEEEETLALVTSIPLCFGLEKLVRGSGTSNRKPMMLHGIIYTVVLTRSQ